LEAAVHRVCIIPTLLFLIACSEAVDGKDGSLDSIGDGSNVAPTCEISAPSDGTTAAAGEELTFMATARDADQSADELLVSWSSDIDGPLRESTALPDGSVVFSTRDLSSGTHRVTLLVEDAAGERCGAGLSIAIGSPPAISLTAPASGTAFSLGEPVVLEATVSDAEDPPSALELVVSSSLDGDVGTATPASDGSVSVALADMQSGEHALTVRVVDTDGLAAAASVDIVVVPVPDAPEVSLSPDPAITTDDLVATATESAGTTLAYAWTEDGAALPQTGATLPASETQKGRTYAVFVTPTDASGEGEPGTASLEVSNAAPTLSGPNLDASSVQVGDVVVCTASAADVDPADSPTVAYAWHDGSTGATHTVTDIDEPGDSVTCTATADDGDGGIASASASATVGNSDPVVASVSLTPTAPQVGDTVTCAATTSDADGDTPTVTYVWSGGSSGATYTVVASDNPGDTLTCTATATDPHSGVATGTGTATVANTAPSVVGVSISPSSATNDDTLTCAATATDADGDTPTIAYAWSGGTAGSLGTGATLDLSTSTAASAEVITCTVSASDPDGGTTSDTADLTLSNRAPTASATLSPGSDATADDTLICSASASDADGDATTTTFTWTVGSATTTATTTAAEESTLAGAFSRGDTVVCDTSTVDGKGGTATASASVVIINSPPSTPTVTITPTEPRPSDDLTCAATPSTDADGDTLTTALTWSQNGTEVTALAGSATVTSSETAGGDTWTCAVEVSDGADTVSADATVEICSTITVYRDADGDGHGTSSTTSTSCSSAIPSGYVSNSDDCDDSDADISPDAEELCDSGVDEDCDGATDEDDSDSDGDGWRVCDGDCDDGDVFVNPGVVEICDNGADDDCDGATDSSDVDGDGYDGCDGGTDCNDHAAWVNPGEVEDTSDGLDNDCDGEVDSDTTDDDADGYTEAAGDCDDARPWVNPGAFNIPDSGTDEDCSGADAALSDLALPLYVDATYGSDTFCTGLSTCPYASIAAALAAAGTGNVLVVAEGTYAEDVTADRPIVGGYDSSWAAGADPAIIDGTLTFPTATGVDRFVSRVTVTGTLTFSGSASAMLHDATVEGGATPTVTTDSGLPVLAGVVVHGPEVTSGDAVTIDVGSGGIEIHDSVLFGGIAGDGTGTAGSGGDAITVSVSGSAAPRIRGSAVLGGFGGAGTTGQTGTAARISYPGGSRRLYCNTPGGTGGSGGDVVLVEQGTVLGSWLSNGVPGDGGQGGQGGDGYYSSGQPYRIVSEDGGPGGRGGTWVGVASVEEVVGTTIDSHRTGAHSGAGGVLGWSAWSPNACNLTTAVGDPGPVSTYVGLAIGTASATVSWSSVTVGSGSQEGETTCISDGAGAGVWYSECTAGSDGIATGIESTASGGTLMSSLVVVDGGSDSWVVFHSGSGQSVLSNTLVGTSLADGVYVGGGAMAFANNIVQTATGTTCLHDDAGAFDHFVQNLFYGCTSQIVYDATSGAYRPNIATVNAITATTASGGNLWAAPAFGGSGSHVPSASSAAVDAGYDLSSLGSYPDQGLYRTARPTGSGWDVGAYEQ
jgi:hypothetical protein